jgi:hypothetical protein
MNGECLGTSCSQCPAGTKNIAPTSGVTVMVTSAKATTPASLLIDRQLSTSWVGMAPNASDVQTVTITFPAQLVRQVFVYNFMAPVDAAHFTALRYSLLSAGGTALAMDELHNLAPEQPSFEWDPGKKIGDDVGPVQTLKVVILEWAGAPGPGIAEIEICSPAL